MYATNPAVQFRDPFASNDITLDRRRAHYDNYRASWNSHPPYPAFSQELTPPPEMNGATHTSKPRQYQHEHGHHYGDYMPRKHTHRGPGAPYLPQQFSTTASSIHGHDPHSHHRTISPAPQSYHTAPPTAKSSQRAGNSQANAIAPSFQIPKSINESGGSLSELAAEITCLFWFESSELMHEVEDSTVPLMPSRLLTKDAKPTTGFRKWVTTILSTTLVAQNVVLLALLFVYRLKKLNPGVKGKPGSEYRLLTVALMLGNKFLDDNTYTNKTWAEVSGINVAEVHIMEVEFLSNMKYCLFTSSEDWTKWQSLLGRFAAFLERSRQPRQQPPHLPAPILPPASSLRLITLPSPPASNQASPPSIADLANNGFAYSSAVHHGPTPAPSPLPVIPTSTTSYLDTRKRSRDEGAPEPPAKRLANTYQDSSAPQYYARSSQNQRLTLPSLSIPPNLASANNLAPNPFRGQQLPPLNTPSRAMAMVYSSATTLGQVPTVPSVTGPSSQPPSQIPSQHQSRQPSPGSAAASPTSAIPHYAAPLHPHAQVSPSYFLQQRNSPYRPVHAVSTLLYPPPSAALHHRSQNVGYDQMHYQPLGKSIQQRQSGQLPYVAQNVWLEGNHQQAMTPVHQWPSFITTTQQQPHAMSQPGH